MIKKEQRVGVFVDVQNMYYSAKNLHHSKVDYRQLLNIAVQGRKLIRAIAYVIKADVKDEGTFFDALEKIGYQVKGKELQTFAGGAQKGDWDVGLAMDMIELSPKLDAVVLVSGDGDFVPLVQHLRRALGCRVEVVSFRKSSSKNLVEQADKFIDLDKKKQVLLKK